MFGLSFFELLAIFTVALLVFGPEKLPEIAKLLGKFSGELKRTSDSVRREFYNSIYPPAEELQATYRKLKTTPLFQLEGTCEEKAPRPDANGQENGQQPVVELNDSRKNPPTQTNPNPTSTPILEPDHKKDSNSSAQAAHGSTHLQPETSEGK